MRRLASYATQPTAKAVVDGNGKPQPRGSVNVVWTEEHHPLVEIAPRSGHCSRQ